MSAKPIYGIEVTRLALGRACEILAKDSEKAGVVRWLAAAGSLPKFDDEDRELVQFIVRGLCVDRDATLLALDQAARIHNVDMLPPVSSTGAGKSGA